MTVEQITALRTALHAITHKRIKHDTDGNVVKDSNGQVVTETVNSSIIVTMNNNYGCNEAENEMWWDDTNGLLYFIGLNEMERNSTTIEFGHKVHVPAKLTVIGYADIQMLGILIGEDTLDEIIDAMKAISGVYPAATVTANARNAIYYKYFKAYGDMQYNIDKHTPSGYGITK